MSVDIVKLREHLKATNSWRASSLWLNFTAADWSALRFWHASRGPYPAAPRATRWNVVFPGSMPTECICISMILLVRRCLYDPPATPGNQAADHLISRLSQSNYGHTDFWGMARI